MKISVPLSKYACLLIVSLFTLTQFIDAPWNRTGDVIKSDVKGYYAYLPALFIHNDLKLKDVSPYQIDNGSKIWYVESTDGIRHIKYPIGAAVLYAPFFGLAHIYAGIMDHTQDGFSTPYLFTLSLSALFYLVLSLIFFRKILIRYFSEKVVALTLLLVFLGTNVGNYYTFDACFSHIYSFLLITLFIYSSLIWTDKPSYKYAFWVGLSAGIMTLIRPIDVFFVLFLPLLFLFSGDSIRERLRLFYNHKWQVFVMVSIGFVCILPQLVYFKYISDQWLFYSYSNESFFFSQPKILEAMFSYRNGWLIYSPLMALSIVGAFVLRRRYRTLFVPIIIVCGIYIFIIASWWCWWYVGFGNRAFINLYPFLSFPVAAFIALVWDGRSWSKFIFSVILIAGISLSIFQTLQFNRGVIHWGYMSQRAYYNSFFKWNADPLFSTYLEVPNLEKALRGETAILKRSIDTVFVKKIDFEDAAKFDTLHATLIQRKSTFLGEGAMVLPDWVEYALGDTIEVRGANRIHISAWVKNPEEFSFCLTYNENEFYTSSSSIVDQKNGWNKVELYAEIPEFVKHKKLSFFIWKMNRNTAYIDELKFTLTHEEFVED